MNQRLQVLFNRYVDGTITELEKEEFFQILSEQEPETEKSVNRMMDQLWSTLPDQPVSFLNVDETFHKIKESRFPESQPQHKYGRSFTLLKVAAVLGFLATSAVGIFLYTSIAGNNEPEVFAVSTQKTDPRFLRLPDGSTVLLNEGSKLEYPTVFAGNTREVYLQGEGFFDIQHDPSKPFLVKTANVTTTVLGTAFNIRAFPSDKHITVTVTRGKVKVSKDEKVLGVITHDQQITVERQTQASHLANVNSKETTGWMERDIHFNDVTMEDAVAELSNRFGVQIQLKNEQLRSCKFTATFVKGEDIEQILVVITEFNNATFVFDKATREIVIDGSGCTPKSKT